MARLVRDHIIQYNQVTNNFFFSTGTITTREGEAQEPCTVLIGLRMRRVANGVVDSMSAHSTHSTCYRDKMAQITASKPPERKLLAGEFPAV